MTAVAIVLIALGSLIAVGNVAGMIGAGLRARRGAGESYSNVHFLSLICCGLAWLLAGGELWPWVLLPALLDPANWLMLALPFFLLLRSREPRDAPDRRRTRSTPSRPTADAADYATARSSPDVFHAGELDRTVRCLQEVGSTQAQAVERAPRTPIDKPPLHQVRSRVDPLRIDLPLEVVSEVVGDLLSAEAAAVSPEGETTPEASQRAGLVDRWGRYQRWLESRPGPSTRPLGPGEGMAFHEAVAADTLGLLLPERLPEIATQALCAGLDSPSLAALAGESPRATSAEELRLTFERALRELGVARPAPIEAAETLRDHYAREVAAGRLSPRGGAAAIVEGVLDRVHGELPAGGTLGESLGIARLVGLFYDYDLVHEGLTTPEEVDAAVVEECRRILDRPDA